MAVVHTEQAVAVPLHTQQSTVCTRIRRRRNIEASILIPQLMNTTLPWTFALNAGLTDRTLGPGANP